MKLISVLALAIFLNLTSLFFLRTERTEGKTSNELSSLVLHYEKEERDPFTSLLRLKEEKMREKEEQVLPASPEFPLAMSKKLVTNSDFELLGIVWNLDGAVVLLAKDGLPRGPFREGQRIEGTPYRVVRIEGKIGEVLLWADNEIIRLTFSH